jgi:hypothetical protein
VTAHRVASSRVAAAALLAVSALACGASPAIGAGEVAKVRAGPRNVEVSLIEEGQSGIATMHGWEKLKTALTAKGIPFEEATDPGRAQGSVLIVAGPASGSGLIAAQMSALRLKVSSEPESLLIHKAQLLGRQALLLSGSDDRGLMYALLEVAKRIGWAANSAMPLTEVRDTVESPSVKDRGVILFTMQKHQYEDRLHDESYWEKYLDMLADDRFNTIEVLFAYEANGYNCPVYPFYIDVNGFPEVKVARLSKPEQQRNLGDLHRLVRMAHERGVRVTFGIWCHYYRTTAEMIPVDRSKPAAPNTVEGLTESNLVAYTIAAMGQFLREFHEIDAAQLLMMDESGLKTSDMKEFWREIFPALKKAAPNIQYELRAKGVSDDLIQQGIDLGLKIRVNTKFWTEQVGLPFLQTHVDPPDQMTRRGGYADMLRYPRQYQLHWTLWTAGTTRVLLWGDPEYVRRFSASTHLGGADGFEIHEPLATKMAGQPHEEKPFELLSPAYRYYDYEFQRYWYFFEVFGRVSYDPNTPAEEWDHEFVGRFGKDAAPYVKTGLERASQILPRITAYCQPADHYSTTRGWPERQRQGDLPEYVEANPSDPQQFETFHDAADDVLGGRSSPKITPLQTSRWFASAARDVRRLIARAEPRAGPHPGKEFTSTIVDLKLLADLAEYHSYRAVAGLSYALFERTHDLNTLDDAIQQEAQAVSAWAEISRDAGDVYGFDLKMGLREADLSGHWRDELVKLRDGLAALRKERDAYRLEARRQVGTFDLGGGGADPVDQRVTLTERAGSRLATLDVPDGRYEIIVRIRDDKASHGPMWIETNGSEYSDTFMVAAGQSVERTMETTAVNGGLKVLFDHATSADSHAGTLAISRVDPVIAHVPVRRLAPGQALQLRATVTGVVGIEGVRAYFGNARAGFSFSELQGDGIIYSATIPAAKLQAGTSYFLRATDSSGRVSTFPEDGASQPIPVLVTNDGTPPALRHTPFVSAQALHPLRITALVKDPSGVKWVHLRYRGLSEHQDFKLLNMLPTGKDSEYAATVPGEEIDPHFDFMYLFEVMDNAGNGKIYPDLAKETPYIVVNVESELGESHAGDR